MSTAIHCLALRNAITRALTLPVIVMNLNIVTLGDLTNTRKPRLNITFYVCLMFLNFAQVTQGKVCTIKYV